MLSIIRGIVLSGTLRWSVVVLAFTRGLVASPKQLIAKPGKRVNLMITRDGDAEEYGIRMGWQR